LSPVIDEREDCTLPVVRLFPPEQGSEEGEFPTAQEFDPLVRVRSV